MNQEININLNLILDTDSDLSKEEIKQNIEAAFNTLFTSLNVPLSNYLSKYDGGDLLLDVVKVEVLKVETESEIYQVEKKEKNFKKKQTIFKGSQIH